MKKSIFSVALAALVLVSCQVVLEDGPELQDSNFTLKASIEQFSSPTKADMDADYKLVWRTKDKIGLSVPGWGDNQPFTLVGDGGTYNGSFTWDNKTIDNSFPNTATAAFFPWQGTGSGNNNVYGDNMYFKLRDSYYGYTSGKMLNPLVAQVTTTGEAYDPITFKHAGAAIKVTVNNLPAGAHSIGLGVVGQQIWGDYHINIAEAAAGTGSLVLDGDAAPTQNKIWLNFTPSNSERPFTFIFPVPALTKPSLQFVIYDDNNIMVWKKILAAQTSDLALGDVLVMPAIDITPYAQFTTISSDWTVCGTANGTDWDVDFPMVTDGTICIAKGLTFAAGGEFKVRKGKDWGEAYPVSNYVVESAGTYDVIFNASDHSITCVSSTFPYPNKFDVATQLGTTETANCYIISAAGSYLIPAVKGNSATSVGSVASASLLWETYNNAETVTANSVIADVDYDGAGNIYFRTPSTLKPGNAGIAAKDGEGNILWSWHIWIPETTVDDVGDYSVSKKYFMDRNLGALVATEATSATVNVQSFGMLYQWGRKDPFPGARAFNTSDRARTEGVFRFDQDAARTEDAAFDLTASYANPMIFAKLNAWRTGVTEWNPGGVKSIDDPCPAGYKVPDYNSSDLLWGHVENDPGFEASTTYGWWKIGQFVFPLCGYCESGGSMSHAYDRARLVSGTMLAGYDEYASAQYLYDSSGTWKHDNSSRKRYGSSVRCAKIEGEIIPSPATSITLDGTMTDWSDGQAIAGDGSYVKEWKYAYDGSNLYFYFKIPISKITFDTNEFESDGVTPNPYFRSYRLKRYIYIALDTDNNDSTGANPGSGSGEYDYGGLGMNGCDALALVYPYSGTAPSGDDAPSGLEFVNGEDTEGWTRVPPSGSRTGKHATVYGIIDGSYALLEVGLPMDGIGSPSDSKVKVDFSFNWNIVGTYTIELN